MFLKNFLKISDILLDFRRQKLVSLESVAKAKCLVGWRGCDGKKLFFEGSEV